MNNTFIDVPEEIEECLAEDEVVEKEFELDENWTAYASTKRIFLKKRRTVRDIDYNDISNIHLTTTPNWITLSVGILSIIVGYFLQQDTPLGWSLIFAGMVLLYTGVFVWKKQRVELSVESLSRTLKLSGKKDTLDSLFILVREHRVSP